jgi:hypothetical protein
MHLPKEKGKTTIYKTENQRSINTNPAKNACEHKCLGRISSSCSTCGANHVTLVTNKSPE